MAKGAGPESRSSRRALLKRCFLAGALLSLACLAFIDWDRWPHDEGTETAVKGRLALAVTFLIGADLARREGGRRASQPLLWAAVLSLAAYFNLGAFHSDRFHHDWEQFHYTLGARYFPELGYDGLYAASLLAQMERPVEGRTIGPHIRDLRTNDVTPSRTPESQSFATEVRERFTTARWESFVDDHEHFVEHTSTEHLARMRLDHGFNPPPSWTFVARLFAALPGELSSERLDVLGAVDVALLVIAFVVAGRTFGSRKLCYALILFGLSYAGRFFWVGGAFLRHDWLAALILGVAWTKQERHLSAGFALGYAAAIRLFPLAFVVGPSVLALRSRLRGEDIRWAGRMALGVATALVAALLLGGLTGRGMSAWSEFAAAIDLHRGTWLTNNVGLENVALYGPDTMQRKLVDFSQPEPWIHWQEHMDGLRAQWAWLLVLFKGALAAGVGHVLCRRRVARHESVVLGALIAFTVFLTTCYYWQMLTLFAFLASAPLVLGAWLVSTLMWGVHHLGDAFELRYGLFSWLLFFLLALAIAAVGRGTADPSNRTRRMKKVRRA